MGLETAAILMAALAVGGTAYGVKQQNDAAKVEEESAKNAAAGDYQAIEAGAEQTTKAANQQALQLKRMALVERGRIMAAQAETNFMGNSPLRELLNARLKEKEALGTNRYNEAGALLEGGRDSAKVFANATSRVNEAKSRYTNQWAAGLMIATAGIEGGTKGYVLGKQIKKPAQGGVV